MAPSAVEIPIPAVKSFGTPTSNAVKAEDLKSPSSPLPEVKSFDASNCSVDELVDALRVAGGVVVRGFLNESEVAQLETDTRPHLEKDTAWGDGKLASMSLCLILFVVTEARPRDNDLQRRCCWLSSDSPNLYRRLLPQGNSPSVWHGHQIEDICRAHCRPSTLDRRDQCFAVEHTRTQLGTFLSPKPEVAHSRLQVS